MLISFVTTTLVGIICIIIGIINMCGNVTSLHSYHRQRVSEENIRPFGILVGIGTITVGISIIAFGAFSLASELLGNTFLVIIGTAAMFVGMTVGLIITFYAMKKYNNGIF